MRWISLSLLLVALGGCASHEQPVTPAPISDNIRYAPATSTALVFDPPVLAGVPTLDLSRDDRDTAAFAGYQDSTTTYYFYSTNDQYNDGNFSGYGRNAVRDDYQRSAFTETYGVSHR